MTHRRDRLISCRDIAGRDRQAILISDRCGVMLVAPAGETAVFSATEVTDLRAALDAAVTDHMSTKRENYQQ